MDIYGFPYDGPNGINGVSPIPYPYDIDNLFGLNSEIKEGYEGLTEAEKEQLIFRFRDAQTAQERREIIDELFPDGNRPLM